MAVFVCMGVCSCVCRSYKQAREMHNQRESHKMYRNTASVKYDLAKRSQTQCVVGLTEPKMGVLQRERPSTLMDSLGNYTCQEGAC